LREWRRLEVEPIDSDDFDFTLYVNDYKKAVSLLRSERKPSVLKNGRVAMEEINAISR
jgi:hypothetical protein